MQWPFNRRPAREPRPCLVCPDASGRISMPNGETISCSLCKGTGKQDLSWAELQDRRPEHIGVGGTVAVCMLAAGVLVAGAAGESWEPSSITAEAGTIGEGGVGVGTLQIEYVDRDLEQWTTATEEPQEDEPGWDCRIHGNRICGPGSELYTPGCYDVRGTLIEEWNPTDHYGQLEPPC